MTKCGETWRLRSTYGSHVMNNSTMKSVAIGVAVAVLLLFVGAMGYTMARTNDDGKSAGAGAGTDADGLESTDLSKTDQPAPPVSAQAIDPTTTTTEAPVREFAELFEELRPAVASVTAVACDTAKQGTAFLVSDTVVYTAASVVVDAAELVVSIDGKSIEARVLGQDPERNVAALVLNEPVVDVAPMEFSKRPARVGAEVGALVHPVSFPLTLTVGRLASVDESQPATVLRTDADAELGSSGGPLIDQRGQVIGIVSVAVDDSGAISAPLGAVAFADVREQLAGWVTAPSPPSGTFCVGNVDLSEIDAVAGELIATDTSHPQITALQRTFAIYSQSINSSRAENAFDLLGPAIRDSSDRAVWAEGQRTSKLWDWRIRDVTNVGSILEVRSVFTSTQDSEFGFDGSSTCTRWDITYDMVPGQFRGESYWLINRSRASAGSGPIDCDDWTPESVLREQLDGAQNSELRRTDRLAGGTVHDWEIGVGTLVPDPDPDPDPDATNDEDETGPVELTPQTLTVEVVSDGGFDPVVEIYDQFGALVAENDDIAEGSTDSRVEFSVTSFQVVSVHVRDVSNRSGGAYDITFTTEADS